MTTLANRGLSVRASARTLVLGILGFGAAALVTSVSALNLKSDEQAVAYATQGGTAILAITALLVLVCALILQSRADRIIWLTAGLSLVLTTIGAGLRSGALPGGNAAPIPGPAEWVYAAGALLLGLTLVVWPLTRRPSVHAAVPLIAGLIATAVVAASFWFLAGQRLVDLSFERGVISPLRMQQMLAFLLVLTGTVMFSTACLVRAHGHTLVFSWAMLTAAMVAVIFGDLIWLWKMAGWGWTPGSFSDFIHISGHVLVVIGASFAVDGEARVRSAEPVQQG